MRAFFFSDGVTSLSMSVTRAAARVGLGAVGVDEGSLLHEFLNGEGTAGAVGLVIPVVRSRGATGGVRVFLEEEATGCGGGAVGNVSLDSLPLLLWTDVEDTPFAPDAGAEVC